MLPLPTLADGHLRLRELRGGDAPAIARACRDPLVQLFTHVPSPYDDEDALQFVTGARGRRMMGESMDLAVAAVDDDRLLGVIGLKIDRNDPRRAEVGYWVAPDERGRGVAGRALALLSRWAVTEGGFARIDLLAAAANTASLRTAARCGFVQEGTLRSGWYRGDGRSDMVLFSLLPSDSVGAGH